MRKITEKYKAENSIAALRYILACLLGLTLAACASHPQPEQRIQAAQETMKRNGFEAVEPGSTSLVQAWVRDSAQDASSLPWRVYIEGDGLAWQGRGRPSANPTPLNPVALHLAAKDPSPKVIYLARPCQFFVNLPKGCHYSDWTNERYAPRQGERLRQALHPFINDAPVIFIGHSGGAHLALQIAPAYTNSQGIVTVAGNLDNEEFSRFHRVAAHNATAIRPSPLPIWSLSGEKDDIIPPELTARMLPRVATRPECLHHEVADRASHSGPWHLQWKHILALFERCSSPPLMLKSSTDHTWP